MKFGRFIRLIKNLRGTSLAEVFFASVILIFIIFGVMSFITQIRQPRKQVQVWHGSEVVDVTAKDVHPLMAAKSEDAIPGSTKTPGNQELIKNAMVQEPEAFEKAAREAIKRMHLDANKEEHAIAMLKSTLEEQKKNLKPTSSSGAPALDDPHQVMNQKLSEKEKAKQCTFLANPQSEDATCSPGLLVKGQSCEDFGGYTSEWDCRGNFNGACRINMLGNRKDRSPLETKYVLCWTSTGVAKDKERSPAHVLWQRLNANNGPGNH